MLGQGAFVLMTSTKHPFNTLQELIAYGKANPGKLNYSTTGPGTPASIVSYRLGQAAGMDWVEIPFKGGAEATQAVMSGDSHAFAASQGAPLIHANPDKMRMAAISAEKRSPYLPNVPTLKELGYPVVYESWSGVFVRSDTPAPIVAKLKTALARVMAYARDAAHDEEPQRRALRGQGRGSAEADGKGTRRVLRGPEEAGHPAAVTARDLGAGEGNRTLVQLGRVLALQCFQEPFGIIRPKSRIERNRVSPDSECRRT